MGLDLDPRKILEIALAADCSERTVRRYLEDPHAPNKANRESIARVMRGRPRKKQKPIDPKAYAKSTEAVTDIAKAAGCSRNTVWNYLKAPSSVTQGNRARIERVLKGKRQ